ncbi:MAG: LON peptidase substrate-binding domain-containing protein [Verrucomicrobiota bacterium]
MKLDIMVLEGVVLLPKSVVPLNIFEPRYRKMLHDSLEGGRTFALGNLIDQRPARYIGVGLIQSSLQHKDGTYQLILEGVDRYRIERILATDPVLRGECEKVETQPRNSEDQAMRANVKKIVHTIIENYPQVAESLSEIFDDELDDSDFCDLTGGILVGDSRVKQKLLETESVEKRLTLLHNFLDTARLT